MAKLSTLSTNIDSDLKQILTQYCKKNGLKIQSFIEKALLEQLEDEMDLKAYHSRKNEEEISLEHAIKSLKK